MIGFSAPLPKLQMTRWGGAGGGGVVRISNDGNDRRPGFVGV